MALESELLGLENKCIRHLVKFNANIELDILKVILCFSEIQI